MGPSGIRSGGLRGGERDLGGGGVGRRRGGGGDADVGPAGGSGADPWLLEGHPEGGGVKMVMGKI